MSQVVRIALAILHGIVPFFLGNRSGQRFADAHADFGFWIQAFVLLALVVEGLGLLRLRNPVSQVFHQHLLSGVPEEREDGDDQPLPSLTRSLFASG